MNNIKYENLNDYELEQINGGIAPVLIGVGIVGSLTGGFALGYGLARAFG